MNDFSRRVFSPSELNREARIHLEAGFGLVDVEGEVSNLARPASGHVYFSLKDAQAQIRCAMFRNRAMLMNLRLENGQQVRATVRVSLYEPRGEYQLIVERVAAAGEGRLRQLYEELKQRLTAEGLFDPARKSPLPRFPGCIGLITSPSGAAVRDLLQVLKRRYPMARVRIYPSAVQGAEAPSELRRALALAIEEQHAEVLIIGRGGGSLEDLWAFNDEALVRAVAACPLPIISAVGHEVDFSLCDEAADLRAPTPSAAAELATPDQRVLLRQLQILQQRLRREFRRRLDQSSQRLDYLSQRLQRSHPQHRLALHQRQLEQIQRRLHHAFQGPLNARLVRLQHTLQRLARLHPERQLQSGNSHLSELERRLERAVKHQLHGYQQQFAHALRALHQVSPLAVLARGYGIAMDHDSGQVISSLEQAQNCHQLRYIAQNFEIIAQVEQVLPRQQKPPGVPETHR